jgi:uncharacterized protein YegJ (DUF2314 family)
MKQLVLLLVTCLMLCGCAKKPETLTKDYEQAEMDQAIAKARSTVDEFILHLGKKDAATYSVKAAITDSNGTEHFWINDVVFKEGVFSGVIANEPGIVENVSLGQAWSVKKEEISDWMYTVGGKIHGGYTIDPLLAGFPKDKADALKARLVR